MAAGRLSVNDQLLHLHQGSSSNDDYTLEFRTLSTFHLGLNPRICAQMAMYDDSVGLETFMQCASCISQHLNACFEDEATHQLASPAPGPPVTEPMQGDSAHLSRTERARRIANGLSILWISGSYHQ